MDHGKIIAQGTPKSLLQDNFNDVILQLPYSELEDFDLSEFTTHEHDGLIDITTCDVNDVVAKLLKSNVSLSHLQIRPRTLDDLFLELTGKELRT